MNYQKMDASLSAALDAQPISDDPNLSVFVRTNSALNSQQVTEIKKLGIDTAELDKRIFAARLSTKTIAELSEKPWIRLISLSHLSKPLK